MSTRGWLFQWRDMSTRGLLFQWASTKKMVLYKSDLISLKINLFSAFYNWKIAELALNNNHSLTHINLFFFLNAACLVEKQQIQIL
jgi:hypothetical protein